MIPRAGKCLLAHPFALEPTLGQYCAGRHILVSDGGDPTGATDGALAAIGRTRRIVLTGPNFAAAMMLAGETDLTVPVPEGLLRQHGPRFGLAARPLPVGASASMISRVATRAASLDSDGGDDLIFGANGNSAIEGGEGPAGLLGLVILAGATSCSGAATATS